MGVPTGILQAKNAGKLRPVAQGARKAIGSVEKPGGLYAGKHVAKSAFGIEHSISKDAAGTLLGPIYSAGQAKKGKAGKAYATHYTRTLAGSAAGAGLGAGVGALAGGGRGALPGALIGTVGGSLAGSAAGSRAVHRKGYIKGS